MESCRLICGQTRYIFETNTIGVEDEVFNVDDVIGIAKETVLLEEVADKMKVLLAEYNRKAEKTFEDILDYFRIAYL